MISEIIMMMTVIWSMPFYVPDDTIEGGYQVWTLEIVDELCNKVGCIGGLTSAYPVARVQIIERLIFDTEAIDEWGCTAFMHEMWHAWHMDYNHEIMGWCHHARS